MKEILQTILTESGLKHSNHNNSNNYGELDFLREYNIDIEDHDFGGIKVAFPRSVS